jgi:hypothetical protein
LAAKKREKGRGRPLGFCGRKKRRLRCLLTLHPTAHNSFPHPRIEDQLLVNIFLGYYKIGMDFIVVLPRTRAAYDSIWVVVDCLNKSAHFIPVKTNYSSAVLAELYMSQIVCLHGVPKKIVSDRGTQFTSHFWQQLHEALGTHLNFSSAYHP